MKKETYKIAQAFLDRQPAHAARTSTDGDRMFLHGNLIAEHRNNGIFVTLAGWGTVTTRERLNGLAELLGKGHPFHQKDYAQYFNDREIDSDEWIRLA